MHANHKLVVGSRIPTKSTSKLKFNARIVATALAAPGYATVEEDEMCCLHAWLMLRD